MHACGHARNRLLHACEAISLIGGLAQQWRKPYTPTFSIEGAHVQDARAGSGEEAAHVLAGQILIDGYPPWTLARGERQQVALLARFMVTSAVPAAFNVADSAAEKAGLTEAFLDACRQAWARAAAGQPDLTVVYNDFLENAGRSFRRAELAKTGRKASAASRGDTRTSDDRMIETVILKVYQVHGVTAKEAWRLFPLTDAKA